MNPYNLLRGTLLTLMLICFLVVPQKTLAIDFNFFNFNSEEDYQVLSEFESKRILQNFSDKLYDKWEKLTVDGYSDPMERTVICLLKEITILNMWNYLFRDLPLDISFNIAKQSVEIAKLVGTEDASGMLGKIERETAKAAVSYLKEYFFKNQIKVSFGAMEVKYKTELGAVDSPFQYIIMYKPIDENRGKVVARIYSPKEIIPPPSKGSIGMIKGFLNSLDSGQNISPFIVEISGEMSKSMYGSYVWNGTPEIKTIFPENVPDFGLKPLTWQEKYIINPIKSVLEDFSGILDLITGDKTEVIDYVIKENGDQEKIDKEMTEINKGAVLEKQYPIENNEEKIEIKNTEKPKEEVKKEVEKKKEEIVPIVCSKNNISNAQHQVVFNEIAWMGSVASSNDEWIELKNVSSKDINLKGWSVSDKGDNIKIAFGSLIIPANGFILLERTDDNTVPFKQADLIYQGALSNKDEELYLFNNSCGVEDYVSAGPDWAAGNNTEKRTMERMGDFSWLTYSGSGTNNILGTPKEVNSLGKKEEKKTTSSTQSNNVTLAVSGGGSSTPIEVSYCPQLNLSSPTHSVVINEVAWMGSLTSSSDEWIELKNSSGEIINMNNWQLLDQDNQVKIVFSSADTIDPNAFYLLERTDDNSVPNILTDKIYSGALSDTNESLRLFDSSCQLIDEVLASPDWPNGDKENKKTMERSEDFDWHKYSLSLSDSMSGLWGTPKASNSPEVLDNQEESAPEEQDDSSDEEEEEINSSSRVLITEIQNNGTDGHEYVELFNQTEDDIDLCPDEDNCYFLSYYSPNSNWNSPTRNWKFPEGETISSEEYYIIDIFGDNGGDYRVETAEETDGEHYYSTGQIGNSHGSIVLFSNNPKYLGDEEKTEEEEIARAISLKVDAAAWSNEETAVVVKENEPFLILNEEGKILGRKWANRKYKDSDNNSIDFQMELPSLRNHAPKSPSPVDDLSVISNPNQKNSVILSWTDPEDEDTKPEDIAYEIYYSRNALIDENNLLNIADYVDVEIADGENNTKIAIIPDLYFASEYNFAIKAKDPEGNYSSISNIVSQSIQEAFHQKPAPYYDFMRSNHSKFSGPKMESVIETVVVAKGENETTNDDTFYSPVVIGEDGTIYFFAEIDRNWGIYAYNSDGKKWRYPGEDFNEISLGKDGSIYAVTAKSVYALSPSGKLEWKKDFERVYTRSIVIDSEDRIYFIASEEPDKAILFSFDGENIISVYDIGSLGGISYSELVIDGSNNIFFSKSNSVFKFNFGSGKIAEKSFPVVYDESYLGEEDKFDVAEQVYVAFSGTVLVNISGAKCCYYDTNQQSNTFYALDNDLNNVLWSKENYGSPSSIGENEFYMSVLRSGGVSLWDISAVDLLDGSIKWTKRWIHSSFFSPASSIASDGGSNVYLTQDINVLGYDSLNITDEVPLNDTILSLTGSSPFCYTPLSIGDGVMYIPAFDKLSVVKY
ncbi:MAG: lamin tail domain-containing protein [Candidatus Paceibacterota bacterium]|jgi:hypothetical protein